jgi:hypothetical protein
VLSRQTICFPAQPLVTQFAKLPTHEDQMPTKNESTIDELPVLAAEMQRTLIETGAYFAIQSPRLDDSTEMWLDFSQRIRRELRRPEDTLTRLSHAAAYVAETEANWDLAREQERSAKVRIFQSVIEASLPCLYALSEPMIAERFMGIPGLDERRKLSGIRGLILLDGWDRDAHLCLDPSKNKTSHPAGKSLALLDDGTLVILDHEVMCADIIGYKVVTQFRAAGPGLGRDRAVRSALEEFGKNRNAFTAIINKLVKSVLDLANNKKRTEQTQKSFDIAEKFTAIAVLLES